MPTKATAKAPAPSVKRRATVPEQPSIRVLRHFRIVFNAVKSHFREVESKAGVAGAQLWALSVIRDSPGLGMNELASAMDVHQSTASNLVRTLVDQELVAAKKRGLDRRTVQLHLLPAGTRVLRRAPGPFTGVLPKALADLDAQTLTRLDKDLGKLIALLHGNKRAGGIPLGEP